MTTLKLTGGDLGREKMMVRANLSEASSPVQVDYCEGHGWEGTQWQTADCRHRASGLMRIAKLLAARAVEMDSGEFDCDVDVVAD